MAQKTVNLTLVADYVDPPDPPESNAEISLAGNSYTVNENAQITVTIRRSVRTDQVIGVDWAAINVSVTPSSGGAVFQIGETEKLITLTALEVDTDELGSFELSNPTYISGPLSQPILVAPSTAEFRVLDISQVSYGFPRLVSWSIGGGGQTSNWSQTGEWSQTAIQAFHDLAAMNFPAYGNSGESIKALAAQTMRNHNPNVLLGTYESAREIADPDLSVTENSLLEPIFTSAWFKTGTGGATDGDGLSRRPDGVITSSWPRKYDINASRDFETFYTGQIPRLNGSYIPGVYTNITPLVFMKLFRYFQDCEDPTVMNLDFMYWDIGNWHQRWEERRADYNRDGIAEGEIENSWDSGDPADPDSVWGYDITQNRVEACAIINAYHKAATGKDLVHYRNSGSHFDWYRGANAHTGPRILTAADQPADQQICEQGTENEHWLKFLGYEPDGSYGVGAADSNFLYKGFDRAYKILSRQIAYYDPDPLTGTKVVGPNCYIDRSVAAQTRYTIGRFAFAITTIAGAYFDYEDLDDHRAVQLLDEAVADDIFSLSYAVALSKKHWLGFPVGEHPQYDDTFLQGVRGGILPDSGPEGIYCMEFDNGLVLAAPHRNGNRTVTLPSGNWRRFLGGQTPAVNDGATGITQITLNEENGIFLVRA